MPAKCDICGVETKVEEAFYLLTDKHTGRTSRRCPACWLKRRSKDANRVYFYYLSGAVMGLVALASESTRPFGWFMLNFVLYYVLMMAAAVPHELGHIFAAQAVGFRPFYAVIGYGKVLFERPFGYFTFQIRSIPFGGFAISAAKTSHLYRFKRCVVIAAGPLANLCVAAATVMVAPVAALGFDFTSGPNFPCVFFVANVVCFGYSLVPHTFQSIYGATANDGLLFWRTLSLKKEQREGAVVFYYLYEGADSSRRKQWREAGNWYEKGLAVFSENDLLLHNRGSILAYQGRFSEAREVFLKLLNKRDLHAYYRCHGANGLAWADAMIGGDELIQEADKYSREALENMPHLPYFKGTRGTVLVELGQFDEGLKLLKDAMSANDTPVSKALNACYISIAEERTGNPIESRKYAEIARSLDPDCILLDRLTPPVSPEGPAAPTSSAANI